ncbi:hypothetical protein NC653_024496 [Populus alba x Populus x berolinensis]|uniref:Uncharacterized protein n=1 Tax=Populus alba x Populus x berolinensis TaxID=444605 RepID=A0AAD6MBB2_9ROSI|nr:hypothetical protein NC653_024496 [Populus alba x Populus x berolinensis]
MLERRVEEIEEERRSWGRSEGEKRRGEKEKGKGGGEVDANGGHEEDLKDRTDQYQDGEKKKGMVGLLRHCYGLDWIGGDDDDDDQEREMGSRTKLNLA